MNRPTIAAVIHILFCYFVAGTVCSRAYDWSGNPGTGAPDTPYLVSTAEQLNAIGGNAAIQGAHFRLTADIDLGAYDGQDGRPAFAMIPTFAGDFDGDGHVVSGFSFSTAGIPPDPGYGMFKLLRGSIRNLHLSQVSILAPENMYSVGALVGVNDGHVSACTVSGTIVGTGVAPQGNVGMLVGQNSYSGVLVGCSVEVDMTLAGYPRYVGGLAGTNQGLITYCSAKGSISAPDQNFFFWLGGLVGSHAAGGISRSYARVDLSAPEPGATYIGGLVGMVSSWIYRCYSAGSLATGTNTQFIGGLCGLASTATGSRNPEFVGCFWDNSRPGTGIRGIGGNFQFTNAALQGAATAQMQSTAIFLAAGWDFAGEVQNGHLDFWDFPGPGEYPSVIFTRSAFSGGAGTEINPYQLSTAQDILDLEKAVLKGEYFVLLNDIDLTQQSFESALVGPDLIPDNGVYNGFGTRLIFDGNGFTIDGLTIDTQGHEFWYVGLFSNGADVRNLGLTNVTVHAGGSRYVGTLAGLGRAQRCFVTGTITASAAAVYVGGMLGQGLCENCYATVDVLCDPVTLRVGGLSGNGEIWYCYSAGAIVGESRGLVGFGSLVYYSFWDTDAAGFADALNLGGRTTLEMLDRQLYVGAGWDFADESVNGTEDIWYIPAGSYPVFVRWIHCPDVVNMASAPAQALITSSELTVGNVVHEYDQFVPAGMIVSQDPTAGTLVVPGTPVNLLVSLGQPYSGGHGTAADPYRMAVPADLDLLSQRPVDFDKYFLQTADIDMSGYTYTKALISPDTDSSSFGVYDGQQFTGLYDGGGREIRNLTIDLAGASCAWLGMFGRLADVGEVRNLNLVDLVISAGQNSDAMGGICGENYGIIRDCSVTGTLTGYRSTGLGALVGRNYGTIHQCQADATVSGRSYLGGLVGMNMGGSIRHSQCVAHVIGDENAEALGGVAGYNNGAIEYCQATVTGQGDFNPMYFAGANSIGGVVGHNRGSIFRSSATGSLYGAGFYSRDLGGLVGYAESGTLVECFSAVTVTTGDVSTNVGGLAGTNKGEIRDCYATGNVTGGYESLRFGGLIGYNYGGIDNCYSVGIPNGHLNSAGLAGNNRGLAGACFWDVNTSGTSTAAGINSTSLTGMTGHTTALMQTRATFEDAGWDFGFTWRLDQDGADYPKLAWQNARQISISMAAGWNLISFPFDPLSTTVADVFSLVPSRNTRSARDQRVGMVHVGDVREWDAVNQVYQPVATVRGQRGYWVFLAEPGLLTVAGTPTDRPVSIEMGWNLVGPAEAIPVPNDAQINDVCWGWSTELGAYRAVHPPPPTPGDEMLPGEGYWVHGDAQFLLDLGH